MTFLEPIRRGSSLYKEINDTEQSQEANCTKMESNEKFGNKKALFDLMRQANMTEEKLIYVQYQFK